MKICVNCNIEYESGNFCLNCGKQLTNKEIKSNVCNICGESIPQGTICCPKCGNRIYAPSCLNCGNIISIEDEKCSFCGKNLTKEDYDNVISTRYSIKKSPVIISQYPEPMYIAGTEYIPNVKLDRENGIFEISGKSIPEDAVKFYDPIIEWIKNYIEDPLEKTVFSFKMTYFNTTTSKIFLGIVQKLEKINPRAQVHLKWYYAEEDEEMEEFGEVISEILNINIEMIPVEYNDEDELDS
ncbi:MAG: SiaC family regulatory phosphoprotein [Bacteroidales bacterium]|nr:SiaC family regulatory phosphoprotein [Bacteroidales bacterium]MBR6278620.1 SiaC family regulatory phosphoprotein [Bacteroidales bacterium]